ncbi:phosphoethanolamine transferase [Helicobacter bizzozeronii]|uniref:phosphoethanolamine transferase n=1 Tax=Helicobacter bizzozeronii TaxID=56877 RepID=UPI000CEE0132|nr:phosphoethanolamine transferase [Helicobacter bizzozeronii]
MILDSRFLLCWLAPVVVSGFSVSVQTRGELFAQILLVAFYGFAFFYVFYFLLAFIPSHKITSILKSTLCLISLVLTGIDFFSAYYLHMGFTPALVGTLLATNLRETQEFMHAMLLPHWDFVCAYVLACGGFLWFVHGKINLSRKFSYGLLTGLFGVFGVHTGINYYLQGMHGIVINPNITTHNIPVVKEILAISTTIKDYTGSATLYKNLRKPLEKDYLSVESNSVPIVILIIGEGASRDFMGVYGYGVPNTPLANALQKSQNLFVFDDVISAYAITAAVFPTLLSYRDFEHKNTPWYAYNTIGKVFKQAGYETFWIDVQDDLSRNNIYAHLAHPFTHKYWTNAPLDIPQATQDIWAFEMLGHIRPQLQDKNFILLHLFGSHFIYSRRFPKSFAKFTPKDIPYQGLHVQNEGDKQIVADYVDSIYYTDHILNKIFQFFKDKDAIIFYLSDHAQDIFQSSNTYGHSCSAYGVEIPFVIYVTDTFKQKHHEKVKAIAGAVDKPFMSNDLIHSLLPLVGIHTKDNLESKNLFSPRFDTKRKRIYCDNKIYKRN